MRALWSDRPNCSHNVSQKVKRIRCFSDFSREPKLNFWRGCFGFWGSVPCPWETDFLPLLFPVPLSPPSLFPSLSLFPFPLSEFSLSLSLYLFPILLFLPWPSFFLCFCGISFPFCHFLFLWVCGRLSFYHYWCWRAGGAAPVKTSTLGDNFPRKIPENSQKLLPVLVLNFGYVFCLSVLVLVIV